jgi:hypothetical protein
MLPALISRVAALLDFYVTIIFKFNKLSSYHTDLQQIQPKQNISFPLHYKAPLTYRELKYIEVH